MHLHLTGALEVGQRVVETTKRAGAVPVVCPSQGDVGVERARLCLEPEVPEGVLEVLLEAAEFRVGAATG